MAERSFTDSRRDERSPTLGGGKFDGVPDTKQLESGQFAFGVEPFFSFTYPGRPSAELLGEWALKRAVRRLDAQRTEHTLTYSDPKTGLLVRCVGIENHDSPRSSGLSASRTPAARTHP